MVDLRKIDGFQVNYKFLSHVCLWRPRIYGNKHLIHKLVKCVFICASLFLVYAEVNNIGAHYRDMEIVNATLATVSIGLMTLARLWLIPAHEETLIELITCYEKRCKDQRQKGFDDFHQYYSNFMLFFTLIQGLTCIVVHIMWLLMAMTGTERKSLLPTRYDFDAFVSPAYEITFTFEFIMMLYIGFVGITAPNIGESGMMLLLGAQYDILTQEVKNMKLNPTAALDIKDVDETFCLDDGRPISRGRVVQPLIPTPAENGVEDPRTMSYRQFIPYLVREHQILREQARRHNTVSATNLMFQIILGVFALCGCGFLILESDSEPFSTKKISCYSYVVCAVLDMLVRCTLGSRVSTKCEEFSEVVYDMDWHLLDADLQKMLGLVIFSADRSPKMAVGKFTVLNNEMFTSIMTNTFNVLAVFREFNK